MYSASLHLSDIQRDVSLLKFVEYKSLRSFLFSAAVARLIVEMSQQFAGLELNLSSFKDPQTTRLRLLRAVDTVRNMRNCQDSEGTVLEHFPRPIHSTNSSPSPSPSLKATKKMEQPIGIRTYSKQKQSSTPETSGAPCSPSVKPNPMIRPTQSATTALSKPQCSGSAPFIYHTQDVAGFPNA